jgi:hypothetical protein
MRGLYPFLTGQYIEADINLGDAIRMTTTI